MSASFFESSTVTFLVVDDEPFIRIVITEALDRAGYFAIEAENAEMALDLLYANPGIDVLITDEHLPGGFNGHQLALKACGILPALKVIFMTGDDVAAARIAKQPGLADGVLVKPFRLDDLWRAVEACLSASSCSVGTPCLAAAEPELKALFLYRLTPLGPFPPGADAVYHSGPCIVAAASEADARRYAAQAFMRAIPQRKDKLASLPWHEAALVEAEILGPASDDWTLSEVRIQLCDGGPWLPVRQ